MIKAMLFAGAGGFIGTCGRYLISRWFADTVPGLFPWGTFIVNLIGCFLIGLFLGWMERWDFMTIRESALLITGFCGGFTTFSTFTNELFVMGQRGAIGVSLLYLAASLAGGLVLVWIGRLISGN